MIHLTTSKDYVDEEHESAVIHVRTSRTFYKVAIRRREVTVVGPGIEEEVELTEAQLGLSFEGMAAVAVITLEERE